MSARAAEAVPFTPGAGLVGELARITLTGKRLGRHAEADGGQPPLSFMPGPRRLVTDLGWFRDDAESWPSERAADTIIATSGPVR